MVKISQHLKIVKIRYLRHAEHHAKNPTSLCGLDQTLFFDLPLIFVKNQKRLDQQIGSLRDHVPACPYE